MHELSIATSILEAVSREIERKKLPVPRAIALRVGALSGVLPDALLFSFEAITRETPWAETELRIEEIPVTGKCQACARAFEVQELIFACPFCRSGQIKVIHGEELDIAYLEIDDDT